MDNEEMLQKTIDTTAISSGGALIGDQADKFIDFTVDESVMLGMIRNVRRNSNKGEIDALNLGTPVTEAATENADSGNIYDPTFSKISFNMEKTRSAFNVTKDAELTNVEREGFRNTLMKAFGARMSTDLELLAISGDRTVVGNTALARLLRTYDGWDLQTQSAHLIDAGGKNVSKALFSAMIKAMPRKYLKLIDQMKFWVSATVFQNYAEELSERDTNLGDAILAGTKVPNAFGIPIVRVPLIPEDKEYTVGTSTLDDGSFIWLGTPTNFLFFIMRKFDMYWEFKPRNDRRENTTYSWTDCRIENIDAIVKAFDIGVTSCDRWACGD